MIGTDGAASAIRTEMLKLPRFNFSQQYLDYGYKELTIPAGPDGSHVFEPHALHIWPRGTFMLIALPNIDGTFGCILFLPFEGESSFAALDTESKVLSFFQAQFPDVLPLMPHLTENFFANPTGAMVTIKCSPWHADGKALLLGDAAHAIVPFFGQGMNCAFEDCTVFSIFWTALAPIGRSCSPLSRNHAKLIRTLSPTWQSRTLWKCATVSPTRASCSGKR